MMFSEPCYSGGTASYLYVTLTKEHKDMSCVRTMFFSLIVVGEQVRLFCIGDEIQDHKRSESILSSIPSC